MVRRFRAAPQVPEATVRHLLDLASRAPSAGFSQGWDFVVLRTEEERGSFWDAAAPPSARRRGAEPSDDVGVEPSGSSPAPGWLAGVSAAPTLLVCLSHPGAYLDRYAEPDKGWPDRDPLRWPVPYWDTDTAMAAMTVLLGAVDAGLGALFFGVPGPAHARVLATLGAPEGRRLVGVVALGEEAERVRSPSLRRGRRGVEAIAHWGRYGESATPAGGPSARMADDQGALPTPGGPRPPGPAAGTDHPPATKE